MWSRASTNNVGPGPHVLVVRGANAAGRSGFAVASPGCALGLRTLAVAALATLLLDACSSAPTKPTESTSQPAAADAGKSGSNGPGASGGAAGANGAVRNGAAPNAAAPNGAAAVPVTARGKADFDRAVGLMKAGNTTEAELEFKQVALQFPQLSAPYVNLGILYRKTGHLDQSEEALKTAVEHNDGSAVAWTELGATQRLRGEFPNAAASYEKAIAADPNFAPAYRNLGVVSDLYLGDPERALTAFERYKELTGEEKPVSGWIAELRQRTGKPPLKRPQPPPAAGSSDGGTGGASPGGSDAPPAGAAPQATPGAPQPAPEQKPAEPAPAAAPPPKAGG
jgi:Flp pilus assembly protein TadD